MLHDKRDEQTNAGKEIAVRATRGEEERDFSQIVAEKGEEKKEERRKEGERRKRNIRIGILVHVRVCL